MIENIKFLGRIVSNRNHTPLYVIFFVTSRCNMTCKHCFFWKNLNCVSEMTFDQIKKISESMDNLLFMRLTGGEPFLRKDIPEIVNLFYKNNGLKNLGINTNGFFTEAILENVKKILKNNKINLDVCISIDDIPNAHDKNRGILGAFSHAIATLNALNELKKRYKNFTTTAGMTVFSENQNRLEEIFAEIKKANPTFISVNLVRGNPKNKDIKHINITKYLNFSKKIAAYNQRKNNFYINTQFKDKLLSKKVSQTFIEQKYQGIKCVAADKMAVIYSNGEVHPCETLNKKIGDLSEYRYNFRKLWSSKNRKRLSESLIKNKCFCTHECFLTSSIFLNLRNLINCIGR